MVQKSYGNDIGKLARDIRALERRHNTTRQMLRESSEEFDRRGREFDQRMVMLQEVVFGHAKQTVPPAHTEEL